MNQDSVFPLRIKAPVFGESYTKDMIEITITDWRNFTLFYALNA